MSHFVAIIYVTIKNVQRFHLIQRATLFAFLE